MKYILDSNFFIQPNRSFCPPEIGVSFWNKLKQLHYQKYVYSLDKVRDELFSNEDNLKKWFKSQSIEKDFFIKSNDDMLNKLKEISNWVQNSHYNEKARNKFLDRGKADIFLVSFASINEDSTIVTYETSQPNRISEIKLPDICKQFNARCIQPIEMFRELNEKF
ncbi:MAG: DUF4411 family protein [Bacteroidales bacterium]|nr:DUF4411 family protein [Bacteroidales bacterium]